MPSNMRSLLEDGKLSDVTFVVDGERFKAHRAILAGRSVFFDRQLCGGMRESVESEVVVDDCDAPTFKALLLYLYTDGFEAIEELVRDSSVESDESAGTTCTVYTSRWAGAISRTSTRTKHEKQPTWHHELLRS